MEESLSGPAGIVQLLDEHHLVVLGEQQDQRVDFARHLAEQLGTIPETQTITIRGDLITDLDSLCSQLEAGLDVCEPITRSVEAVIELLRINRDDQKHQYFIWQDADSLLESDVDLFGQLANAFLGVAAEREHISPDVLVLQRIVFIGGDKLGAYAEEEAGQFCTWLVEDGITVFWEVASCVERPPVLTYQLDG